MGPFDHWSACEYRRKRRRVVNLGIITSGVIAILLWVEIILLITYIFK